MEVNESFFLTLCLNSSMSYYPENTTTRFTTQLPDTINLKDSFVELSSSEGPPSPTLTQRSIDAYLNISFNSDIEEDEAGSPTCKRSRGNVNIFNDKVVTVLDKCEYLNAETVALAFFDENVSFDVKRKMVSELSPYGEIDDFFPKRIQINLKDIVGYCDKQIEHFVSPQTLNFLRRFGIDEEFLKLDPSVWSQNESYAHDLKIVKHLKVSRDGTTTSSFVRIYVNWSSVVQGPGQAMRARIAGRVTPSLNRPLHTLEMIELPLASQPTALACCQSTGNLIVAMGLYAILHEFKVETQQLSRLKFIDFEARPWSLAFSFSPTVMELAEDFVTVQDSEHFMVFRLINTMHEDIDQLSSVASTNLSSVDRTFTHSPLLDNTENAVNTSTVGIAHKITCLIDEYWKIPKTTNISFINWDKLSYEEKEESNRLMSLGLLHSECLNSTINFPTIDLENAGPTYGLNHFILNPSDLDVVIKTSSPNNGWSENFAVKKLLQIKISYNNNSRVKNNGQSEFFTCSVMKPLYLKKECNNISSLKKCILKSDNYRHFHGVTCVICTTQEGFLYHFGSSTMSQESNMRCLTTYSFTAPVKNIVLDPTALHALTEAGLESYTLRLGNYAMQSGNKNLKTTAVTEPVCLIGLRSFLGTQHLLSSITRLILLAKAEQSWTLYSLALPTPENLYYDMLSAAKNHKESSLNTYKQLLVEGHALLKLAKNISFHDYGKNRNNEHQSLVTVKDVASNRL
ncbi:uncharacterized protein LOC107265901 [Cephus cinctus]|uniref:Uncharacterized protein LOC107265901 n=1 Tax=Cephus cinctus TaxID=211228 RepID=A0AAJ7BPQ0_CEPCN|nr:uncharacterized protein LOC107265901 [Cephus cinctus]